MSAVDAAKATALAGRRPRREAGILRLALRTGRGRLGAGLILAVLAVAAIGPLVNGTSSTDFVGPSFAGPGTGHGLLGTDALGRDVLARVLDGGWVLLAASIAATVLGIAAGAVLGMVAAYRQGWADALIMRSIDVFLALPAVVFGLLLVSVIGPKLWVLVLAVALTHAPQVARVIRAAALDVSERDFVKATELWGVPPRRIILREIAPNLITPLMVEAGVRLSYSIILVAGLSFLGFGLQPPNADWGRMINENRIGLGANPYATVVPALLIALLAVGTNFFVDAVARVGLGLERGDQPFVAAETPAAAPPGAGLMSEDA